MAKLLQFPPTHRIEDELPLSTMCICGVELGQHSHIGLFCPIYLGREVANYSHVLTFRTAVNQEKA